MARNSRLMTDVFGKRAVNTAEPDGAWPLASELVGIEIEVENLKGDSGAAYPEWTIHEDHSLRNGVEFVTSGPVGGKLLSKTIHKFFACGFKYDMSPRTSVHIHVNASDAQMTMDQFRNLFVIMYLIEPAVFRWADENRKWCGYCSPLTDLDPYRIVSILTEDKSEQRFAQAVRGNGNQDRYYGLNVAAFHKHGTLEFRYFPCTDSEAQLTEWVKFVLHVKAAGRRYDAPADLLNRLRSRADVQTFLEENFGTVARHLSGGLDFDDCLGRVQELLGMLDLTPEQVKAGESYKTHRSKGFSKFLAQTFPESLDKPDDTRLAQARLEVDRAYKVFAVAVEDNIPHDEMMAAHRASQAAIARLQALERQAKMNAAVQAPLPPVGLPPPAYVRAVLPDAANIYKPRVQKAVDPRVKKPQAGPDNMDAYAAFLARGKRPPAAR